MCKTYAATTKAGYRPPFFEKKSILSPASNTTMNSNANAAATASIVKPSTSLRPQSAKPPSSSDITAATGPLNTATSIAVTPKPTPPLKPAASKGTVTADKPVAATQPIIKPALPAKPTTAEKQPLAPPKTIYVTIDAYASQDASGLSFKAGERAELLEKSENGWWFMKIGTKEGWVPSTFLE